MSNRALLQNTNLCQKVCDYVSATIRGEVYDPSNKSCFVQITCTNPFEISDASHFIRVKDHSAIFQAFQNLNPQVSLPVLKGAYIDLRKWTFESSLHPNTNQLEFEIVITEIEYLDGMGSLEMPTNTTSLLEAKSVRGLIERLRKFYIAQRFNQAHPFDSELIDAMREKHSEAIRARGGAHQVPHSTIDTQEQAVDPFFVWGQEGDKDQSQVSHKSDWDAVSATSQNVKMLTKKPYQTAPQENPFELNFENIPEEPLAKQREPEGTRMEEEPHNIKLPSFGIETPFQEQPEDQRPIGKRSFDKWVEEHAESELRLPQQETKKVKQGWGVQHKSNQQELIAFMQNRKTTEARFSGLDSLDLLSSSLPQAEKFPARQPQKIVPDPAVHRPPETHLRPAMDVEIASEKAGSRSGSKQGSGSKVSYFKSDRPESMGKSVISKMLNKPVQEPITARPKAHLITPTLEERLRQQVQSKKSLTDYFREGMAQGMPILIKESQESPLPEIGPEYLSSFTKLTPDKNSSSKKRDIRSLQPLRESMISGRKSDTFLSSKIEPRREYEQLSAKDYLDSFKPLKLSKDKDHETAKPRTFIENPMRVEAPIDLREFRMASKPQVGYIHSKPKSSSTIFERYDNKPNANVKPYSSKFTDSDFEQLKYLMEKGPMKKQFSSCLNHIQS